MQEAAKKRPATDNDNEKEEKKKPKRPKSSKNTSGTPENDATQLQPTPAPLHAVSHASSVSLTASASTGQQYSSSVSSSSISPTAVDASLYPQITHSQNNYKYNYISYIFFVKLICNVKCK
jgi:hypothetical protein